MLLRSKLGLVIAYSSCLTWLDYGCDLRVYNWYGQMIIAYSIGSSNVTGGLTWIITCTHSVGKPWMNRGWSSHHTPNTAGSISWFKCHCWCRWWFNASAPVCFARSWVPAYFGQDLLYNSSYDYLQKRNQATSDDPLSQVSDREIKNLLRH
jgi:hypothetical protein